MDEKIFAQLENGSVKPPIGVTYERVPAPKPFVYEDVKVKELIAKEPGLVKDDPNIIAKKPVPKKKPAKRKKK